MARKFLLLVLVLYVALAGAQPKYNGKETRESVPLAGIWSFKLDPMEVSIPVKGSDFTRKLPEVIALPGSTDQAGKGFKTQDMTSIRLTRLFEYKGAAWYEKDNVFIPEHWNGKQLFLFLERAHWETKVWVNGEEAGREESLSTPHVYDITPYVKAGRMNTVRIRVDNSMIYDIAYTHAISAETQTNWNGIIGDISIKAFDKVYIDDLQVYPSRTGKNLKIVSEIVNVTGQPVEGKITMKCRLSGSSDEPLPGMEIPFQARDSLTMTEHIYDLGDEIHTWDEFDPNLYELIYAVSCGQYSDETSVTFGIRDFTVDGTRFLINGVPVFMRGAVNSCEFPLTGYPPTDYSEWHRILKTCKDYGLNCIRFHSWCPPKAAFEAADRLGLYLQVENSDWRFTVGEDEATNRFYFEEARRIFKVYSNHPSFMFFCEGNELVGKGCVPFLKKMLEQWKQDERHLYVAASGYPTVEGSDFYEYYGARPQRWKEGLKGRFNAAPLNTMYDYSDYVKKFSVPMITHEIGQWCVYPDLNQVSKYVGVLKPYNYELFREGLRNSNLLDQADDFHMASGKYQVIQKKEEFESYFRTPGFGGYHLLQLNDFPGQGTSPVGVVDGFYDPKPYVKAEEFARFQSPCMPLLRTEKFTWTNTENLTAKVQVANFLKKAFEGGTIAWELRYPDGKVYEQGAFEISNIPVGDITDIGGLSVSLAGISKATSIDLVVSVGNTGIFNEWRIWIYPADLPSIKHNDVLITGKWDNKAKKHLEKGGKVFLLADTAKVDSDVPPSFSGISWNAVWSGTPPNTLGILCDPGHGALADFPTEFHSNWQWFDIVRNSKPMLLDHTPYSFKPIVQIVPDWNNNRKIGLIFEAKVGNGKLLMTSVALGEIKDSSCVARQMYYSLLNYVNSDMFDPAVVLSFEMIDKIYGN